MLRDKIGPVLTLEMGLVCFFCLKNPLLSAGRMRFSKTKKTKKNQTDQFLTLEKAKIGPAEGPPHLALNPKNILFFVLFFVFFFFFSFFA